MKYVLGRGVIGPSPFLDITAQEFGQVKAAKRNLLVLLGVEEKFTLVIDNYLEYERELLELALASMISDNPNCSSSNDAMSLLNRAVRRKHNAHSCPSASGLKIS